MCKSKSLSGLVSVKTNQNGIFLSSRGNEEFVHWALQLQKHSIAAKQLQRKLKEVSYDKSGILRFRHAQHN